MRTKIFIGVVLAAIGAAGIACDTSLPPGGQEIVIDGTRYVIYEATVAPTPTERPRTPTPTLEARVAQAKKRDGEGSYRDGNWARIDVVPANFRISFTNLSIIQQIFDRGGYPELDAPVTVRLIGTGAHRTDIEQKLNYHDYPLGWTVTLENPGTYAFEIIAPDGLYWTLWIG